jgi:putative FmdB family regulatory protein
MSICESKCRKCGERFESFTQRASAIKPPFCPSCGSKEAGRAFSAFAGRVEGGSGGCSSAVTGGD